MIATQIDFQNDFKYHSSINYPFILNSFQQIKCRPWICSLQRADLRYGLRHSFNTLRGAASNDPQAHQSISCHLFSLYWWVL